MNSAPFDIAAAYERVITQFPPRQRQIGGHVWELIDSGGHGPAVLMLPGGLARADTAFRWVDVLSPRYRVISLAYPPTIDRLPVLLDSLVALLDTLGLPRVHLIGGSYSGLVAQCLIRHSPERIATLTLSDTGVPHRLRALQEMLAIPVARHAPLPLVRWLFRASTRRFLAPLPDWLHRFWRPYFDGHIGQMQREAIASVLCVSLEIDRTMAFAPLDDHNARPVLLIAAGNDALFGEDQRESLRMLYHNARIVALPDAAHCASLALMDDYIAWVEAHVAAHVLEIP